MHRQSPHAVNKGTTRGVAKCFFLRVVGAAPPSATRGPVPDTWRRAGSPWGRRTAGCRAASSHAPVCEDSCLPQRHLQLLHACFVHWHLQPRRDETSPACEVPLGAPCGRRRVTGAFRRNRSGATPALQQQKFLAVNAAQKSGTWMRREQR